ncbi:hypothetical protein MNBD_CHLOROFLEXI01-3526, partial [hydrothermal vent metagenome]
MIRRLRFLLVFIFVLAACTRNPAVPLAPMPTAVTTATSSRTETVAPDEPDPTPQPTAIPNFLAWELDGGLSLDNFPPDQPLAIRFNQPMSTAAPQPLIFSPTVRGEFEWSDNNSLLTFTPDAGFSIDRRYSVNLHASLRSSSGLQFTVVQRLQLRTQTAPIVKRRTPSSGIVTDYQPTFALTMNGPMDRASVEAAFSVTPAMPTTVDWDGNTFKVTMDEPLLFGTEYQFTLDKTAVDENGRHLVQPYIWTAQLAQPLAGVSWPTANDHLAPIVVRFNYPIDQASLSDALEIKPAISGKLTWSSDYTTVELTPDSQLPADTAYSISFDSILQDADGNPLPTPEAISFTTPPAILSATPMGLGNHPVGSIKIRFDRLMDSATAEAAFQIEPAIDGRFSWEETTLIFTPETGYLAENSDYTVTIAQTVLGADGETVLNDDYSWSFATKELVDMADFGVGPNAQVLDANGRRAVQFQAFRRNTLNFTFQLYQLNLPQFLDRYESGFHSWIWDNVDETPISTDGTELVAEWQMVSTAPLQDWANVQETILPENVPPGLYILNLVAGNVN